MKLGREARRHWRPISLWGVLQELARAELSGERIGMQLSLGSWAEPLCPRSLPCRQKLADDPSMAPPD